MTRDEFLADLVLWLHGELDADRATEMEVYAAAHPEARALADAERAFDERVKAALVSSVDAGAVVGEMLTAARRQAPEAMPRPGRVFLLARWAASVAAAVLIAFSLGWFYCVGPFECSYVQALEKAAASAPLDEPVPAGFAALPGPDAAAPCHGPSVVPIRYDVPGTTIRACYPVDGSETVVLWVETGEARPSVRRRLERAGRAWWQADEGGRNLVAFVDEPTGLLCCVVGSQDASALFSLAEGIRDRVR